MWIGESFVGSDANVAHINVFAGPKDGPVGTALATGMATPRMGHIPFMAVLRPNLPAKPATLFVNKIALSGERHENMTFGPAQAGVARGVQQAYDKGVLPEEAASGRRATISLCDKDVTGVFPLSTAIVASWWTTGTPSASSQTSNSTISAPSAAAARKACMVFSGSTKDAPRCAIT